MKDFQELYIKSSEFYSGETDVEITEDELSEVVNALYSYRQKDSSKILFAILFHFGKISDINDYIRHIKRQLVEYEELYAEYLEDQRDCAQQERT